MLSQEPMSLEDTPAADFDERTVEPDAEFPSNNNPDSMDELAVTAPMNGLSTAEGNGREPEEKRTSAMDHYMDSSPMPVLKRKAFDASDASDQSTRTPQDMFGVQFQNDSDDDVSDIEDALYGPSTTENKSRDGTPFDATIRSSEMHKQLSPWKELAPMDVLTAREGTTLYSQSCKFVGMLDFINL